MRANVWMRRLGICSALLALLTAAVGTEARAETTLAATAETTTVGDTAAALEALPLKDLPKPPFQYYVSSAVSKPAGTAATKKLALSQKSVKTLSVTFDLTTVPEYTAGQYIVPIPIRNIKGNLPESVPTTYKGQMIVQAIKSGDYAILIYGENFGENRYMVIMDTTMGKFVKAYDFINYAIAPKFVKADYDFIYERIRWATIENGILYVAHSHLTYAKSSNGLNGYITAIRLSDNKTLWRSAPLVSNAGNFVIEGDVILSGYGFTAEKDYLYQLDKRTGKRLDKVLLKDGPNFIAKRNSDLFVYSYSHLTQFTIGK
jgi:outer membrane protein assembly factor BamB